MVLNYCNIANIVAELEISADLANRQLQVSEFNQVSQQCDCSFKTHKDRIRL